MKAIIRCSGILLIVLSPCRAHGQLRPAIDTSAESGGTYAYWYNVPQDSFAMDSGDVRHFRSTLQVYGEAPADEFQIGIEVFLKDGAPVFKKIFDINMRDPAYPIRFSENLFRLTYPVDQLPELPDTIRISTVSEGSEKETEQKCVYHTLRGQITDFDGNAVKGYIAACPDAFIESIGIVSNDDGRYQLDLPERTYNAIIADKETYGISTLEVWAWNVIMDGDQVLNFRIGTGEVYNLNIWPNNGGGSSYFISFRPMTLFQQLRYTRDISGKEFTVIDPAPDLTIEDIRVTINDREVSLISLQEYIETGMPGGGIPAYLLQVSRRGLSTRGKQTLILEYIREDEIEGKPVIQSSMGYYQFYLSYSGLSRHR